jgi:hypothetical protein
MSELKSFRNVIRDLRNERLGNDRILDLDEKNDVYRVMYNSEKLGTFFGDKEDFLNSRTSNYEPIIKKHKLDPETTYVSFDDLYINTLNDIVFNFYKRKAVDKINFVPYGSYEAVYCDHTTSLKKLSLNSDTYIDLGLSSEGNKIHKDISTFFNEETKKTYESLGVRYRASSLLYGPQGTGKTTCLLHAIKECNLEDSYVIYIPKRFELSDMKDFKEFFKNEKVILIIEELTERLDRGIEDLLNFLDGYGSWTNCYIFGTTNHPERLPENIVDRPGRFNQLIEFPDATDEQKRKYMTAKGFTEEEIDEVLPKLKNYALDYIVQLSVQSKVQGVKLTEYIDILNNNKERVKRSFKKNSGKVGLI